ncbi:YmfQ family protein [Providencia stuartii]|uniref:YmfQ family protein n=1 Tax=Providencia stuartii TaxID=588 RepID=UPI001122176C|nr:putative phage tail protein [Providencia stuartii]
MKSILKQLLPPVSYSIDGIILDAELKAEGDVFTQGELSASQIRNSVTPFFAGDLLSDWERILGLSPQKHSSYQQRLNQVLFKLSETGGLSIPYFIALAKNIDYDIQIEEPDPFRASANRAGERLMPEDALWVWIVHINSSNVNFFRFRADGSTAGEPLSFYADSIIESLFDELKPAHTFCYFIYNEV